MAGDNQAMYSVEAEHGVIGGLMIDGSAIDRLDSRLKAEHFYRDDHRRIFAAIQALANEGKSSDIISLADALEATGDLERCGGYAYLGGLAYETFSSANIRRHAEIIIERATLRALRAIGNDIADAALSGGNAPEQVDAAQAAVMALTERVAVRFEPMTARDVMSRHLQRLQERREGRAAAGMSTGFDDLDRRLNGGLHPGQLVILAARPAMGKTSLSMQVALHFALQGRPTLFCSQEMPESDLADRLTALHSRVPLSRVIQTAQMTTEDYDRIGAALPSLRDAPLMLDEQPSLTLMAVRSKARRVVREYGRIELLVIDYLQLMTGEGTSRNAEIEQISRGLKQLAKEMSCPVIALSQLSRQCEQRPNRRPALSDLRDSGAIEQDADIVLSIYRDEIYNAESRYKGLAELGVLKNRQGQSGGFVGLAYQGEFTRFDSLFGGWPQVEQKPQTKQRARGFAG